MRQYNDGGVTLRQAYDEAMREAVATGEDVEFEFALVRLVVGSKSRFEEVKAAFAEGVKGISYLTKQL